MSRYGEAYVLVDVRGQFDEAGWRELTDLCGMHMAFDTEASERLNDRVTDFGWDTVARLMPALHATVGTPAETEEGLETAASYAEHYSQALLSKLVLVWLQDD